MRAATQADVVLDASVVLRALAQSDEAALEWTQRVATGEVHAAWPDLAFMEVANVLQLEVRRSCQTVESAQRILGTTLRLPITPMPILLLAPRALNVAIERSLTAYDASYVVLAEQLGAALVTADRTMAAATPSAVLLS
ncbi:MAG: type II toxin-antitoxin system VapC family toxin [Actinobacteria bacterium]|nr:type II toxin-antitoxin system VapC family toxin [Actinomycetota bacterium]